MITLHQDMLARLRAFDTDNLSEFAVWFGFIVALVPYLIWCAQPTVTMPESRLFGDCMNATLPADVSSCYSYSIWWSLAIMTISTLFAALAIATVTTCILQFIFPQYSFERRTMYRYYSQMLLTTFVLLIITIIAWFGFIPYHPWMPTGTYSPLGQIPMIDNSVLA
jgi:hypothetical protein